MEPRVFNLLLKDNDEPDHNGGEHAANQPSLVLLTTAQLPSIRSFSSGINEDFIDPRLFETNKLPEIDARYQNASASSAAGSAGVSTFETSAGRPTSHRPQAKRGTKSAVPLAEVLNSNSPQPRNVEVSAGYDDSEPRKKRRLDGNGTRTLPEPPSAKRPSKRQQFKTVLPPLLAPLHEPPPEFGPKIVPSINTNDFAARSLDFPPLHSGPSHVELENARPLSLELEGPEVTARKDDPNKNRKGKRKNKWTDEETKNLLQGVAMFGIGSWKKILLHADYSFVGRTAVDLKDRFRTCCPEEYKKSGPSKEKDAKPAAKSDGKGSANIPLRGPPTHRKGPEELAALGINEPFFKRQRRERREFTKEEDEALLKGFEKYPAQWKKIRLDPELGLQSRSRTDLRDRFRNRYPTKFMEAGYKFRLKDSNGAQNAGKEGQASRSRPSQDDLEPPSSSLSALLDPPPSASKDRASHSLKLLTASLSDPQFMDYDVTMPDDDDPTTITLSRNIFAWADQNSKALPNDVNESHNEPSQTISRLDQFHINPLVAVKMSSKQSVPLSDILNGPADVSLPGPSDLVSGLYPDGTSRE